MPRSVAFNSLFNVAYKLLNVVFPLVTTTYVARVLLADGVGKVAYAQNIVGYFLALAALGIPNYGTREIAKIRNDLEKTNKLFSELLVINFFSTAFFSIAYFSIILSFPFFKENLTLHIVVGLSLLFKFFEVTWFYQGFENFAYITIRSFIVKLVCLIWIFLFVKTKDDFVMYALVSVIAIGLNDIFNIAYLKKFNVKFSIKNAELKRHIKPIFVLFASVIAIELYTMVDTTMIGWLCDESSVGLYSNSMKIIRILIGVVSGVAGVLLPRLSYHYSHNEINECSQLVSKALMVMIFLYIPCQLGLLMEGDIIMPLLFGESFSKGGITLQIASLLICTLGFSNLFGTQILLTFGQEKKLFISTIIAAILNVSLNVFLIPIYAQNGAACASVIAEGTVTVLTCFYSMKYIRIRVPKKFVLCSIFSCALLVSTFGIIKSYLNSYLLVLVCSMFSGGIVYIIFNYFAKNPVLVEVQKILSRKKV